MKYKFKNTYKTISQVVKILNTNNQNKLNNHTHTLRYWEKQFKQIKPIKINNRRYYDQKNVDILLKIQYLLLAVNQTTNMSMGKFPNLGIQSKIWLHTISSGKFPNGLWRDILKMRSEIS